MGNEDHQQQDDHRNHRQGGVIENFAGKMRFALLPVAHFGTVFNTHLVGVLEIMEKFMGLRIPVFWISLQGAVQNLLQLRGDGRDRPPAAARDGSTDGHS